MAVGTTEYTAKNRRAQGGALWQIEGEAEIKSGGVMNAESGSTMNVDSGATLNVAGTLDISGTVDVPGDLTIEDGGRFIHEPQTETTGVNLDDGGFSIVNTASAAKRVYTLDAPAAGVEKTIFAQTVNSGANRPVVDATTGITFDGSNQYANFTAAGAAMRLVGLSATRWSVISREPTTAGVTFTTSSTS